jgi:transcriptional regulator with XRE-family HTH domain
VANVRLNVAAVREWQTERGWSDKELAQRADVSPSYLSEMISPKVAPEKRKPGTRKVWRAIADAFEINVRAIIEPDGSEEADGDAA